MIIKNEQESIIYKKKKLSEREKRVKIINNNSQKSTKINNNLCESKKKKRKSLSEPQLNRIILKEKLRSSHSNPFLNQTSETSESFEEKIMNINQTDSKGANLQELKYFSKLKTKHSLKVIKSKIKATSQPEEEKNIRGNLLNPHRIPINVRRALLILYSKSKLKKSEH
jgi:hypothetical protein